MGLSTLFLVLPSLLFGATPSAPPDARAAAVEQCSISISISPSANTVVGNVLSVQARVTSGCQLATVVATVGDQSTPLVFSQPLFRWIGDINVSALPHGPFTLGVTATDVFGTVGTGSVSLVRDTRPTLVITAPEIDALSRGTLRIAATCQDDAPAGCASVTVRLSPEPTSSTGMIVASGVSSVDRRLYLPALLSQSNQSGQLWLTFVVRDSRSQTTEVKRRLYLEPSSRLVEVLRVAGSILDDSADRTLFADDTQVSLLDKTTQQVSTIFTGESLSIPCGSVTSTGAMFHVSSQSGATVSRLYQWHEGQLLDLGNGNCPRVRGDFAIWARDEVFPEPDPLFLKNLSTGDTVTVDWNAEDPAVASNGDVVYWVFRPNTGLWRYRGGVRTNLDNTAATAYVATSPVTDGVNVAYRRSVGSAALQTWLITPTNVIALDLDIAGDSTGYAVANGWTAFTRRVNSSRNIWTRSPSGDVTQHTFYGGTIGIRALGDDGRLALRRSDEPRIYVLESDDTLTDVGHGWSEMRWRNGQLFVTVGRSLMQVSACTASLGATTANVGGGVSSGTVTVTAPEGCRWDAFSNSTFITVTGASGASGNATVAFTVDANETAHPRTGSLTIAGQVFTVTQVPAIALSPFALRFTVARAGGTGAVTHVTPPQSLTVDTPGAAPAWTVTANASWVQVTPGSGTGSGRLTVAINSSLIPAGVTTLTTTITARATLSGATATIPVTLTVKGGTSAPFGQVDTPIQGIAGVQGAIGVTGWALDDISVAGVKVYRECLSFDPPSGCETVLGRSLVFVGDAAFLAGARTDVEAAFSSAPENNRAGWGILILTPMLPHVPTEQLYGGQGLLTLYAVATDVEGNKTLLGRSSDPASVDVATPTHITMANDSIGKPFGAIDTPTLGQTVSGVLHNFGWALTPDSNTTGGDVGDILIPTNGSTMTVYIDSVPVALVAYNQCRGTVGNPVPSGQFCDDDVSNIFGNSTPQPGLTPRMSNPTGHRNLDAGRSPIGVYSFDTSTLPNGLHTIAWSVTDSADRTEGIGSRFFNVLNSGADQRSDAALRSAPADVRGSSRLLDHVPSTATGGVYGRTGFDLASSWKQMHVNEQGRYVVRLPEMGRLELWLGANVEAGYLEANETLRPLPPGSVLRQEDSVARHTVFGWMPPVGYTGDYRLVFLRAGERIDVTVTVVPTLGVRDETVPQILMHLDDVRVDSTATSGRSVRINGWSFDPQASIGSGTGTVHVWARKLDVVTPFFVGVATIDTLRPDVARAFPSAPEHTGFTLTTTLPPGTYEVTAYVWNKRTARWEDARTVTAIVR